MDPTEPWALPASEIKPAPLPMIWRGRIPIGALTVIAGKPGLGKSTLATTIAANLSTDGLHAIISDLEDDLAGVVRPRLEVAGANLKRVFLIPPESAPILPKDFGRLRELIHTTGASCLLLDPGVGGEGVGAQTGDRLPVEATPSRRAVRPQRVHVFPSGRRATVASFGSCGVWLILRGGPRNGGRFTFRRHPMRLVCSGPSAITCREAP